MRIWRWGQFLTAPLTFVRIWIVQIFVIRNVWIGDVWNRSVRRCWVRIRIFRRFCVRIRIVWMFFARICIVRIWIVRIWIVIMLFVQIWIVVGSWIVRMRAIRRRLISIFALKIDWTVARWLDRFDALRLCRARQSVVARVVRQVGSFAHLAAVLARGQAENDCPLIATCPRIGLGYKNVDKEE
jgi:hypothetical protein